MVADMYADIAAESSGFILEFVKVMVIVSRKKINVSFRVQPSRGIPYL
jgi:hypothetical protein